MTELESYAKAIAKKLKPAMDKAEEPKAQRDIFGTVRAVGSGDNISYEVMLDGSDSYTPCTPTVEVHAGDRVVCHIVNHRLIVFSNLTVPSVNDQGYQHVKDIATEANELLDGVSAAAASADKSLAEIIADSVTANDLVSEIETYVGYAEGYTQTLADKVDEVDANAQQGIADIAEDVARVEGATAEALDDISSEIERVEEATADALEEIGESVQAASDAAAEADRKAGLAAQAASEAKDSADTASLYATSALGQLGVVQDVIGVLTWASEHGTFERTSDASVQEGKVYFTYDSQTGDYAPVVEPQASALSTYYELTVDEAMDDFIMSHLAVTSRGLWVLPSGINTGSVTPASGEAMADARARLGSNYKMLLANDGTYIYDGSGIVVAQYKGDGITYAEGRSFHIGSNDAYILYTPASGSTPARITIGGSNIQLGESRTLSELMAEVDGTIVFKVTEAYSADNSTATLTAHVYKGGEDIASQYPASCFAWYRKNEAGTQLNPDAPLVPLPAEDVNGNVATVDRADVGFGAAIVCRFTEPNDSVLLDGDDDTLTDSQETPIAGRTPSGDYVRVADLEVTTTVFDADKLLLVGSEEERLVTIATLKDVFGDGDYERLDNRPSIEGVTLIGDKSFQELGIFQTDGQGYDVPDEYTLSTMDINSLWANAQPIGG